MRPSSSLPLLFLLPAFARGFSSLDRPRAAFLEEVLESSAAEQKHCKPTGLIQDACCDFESVETVNSQLYNRLQQLVATPFFRFHKVDLFKECPFWQEEGSCMNRACGVETTDEEHIPEAWRSNRLGELKRTEGEAPSDTTPGCDVDDADFCVVEDEMDSGGVYVDLLANPERFTGYAGPSSSRVWKAIYEENCFTPVPFIDPSRAVSEGGTGFASLNSMGMGMPGLSGGAWGESERRLVDSLVGPRDGGEEVCLEKRVFYRLISGLHASISIHICDEYLDQTTGEWSPNLQCFITRIAQHPERLQNVYFSYVVLLRALSKAGPQLLSTLAETSHDSASDGTKTKLENLLKIAQGCPSTFDETSMFSGASSQILKTEFKEHFRNVSRIMDCVGCDKCRLWGKLQVTGLGTALKLLFSDDAPALPSSSAEPLVISRGEAVAFVNTLFRFSESLAAVDRFRDLWAHRTEQEQAGAAQEAVPVLEAEELSATSTAAVDELVVDADGSRVSRAGLTRASEKAQREGVVKKVVRISKEGWRSCFEMLMEEKRNWHVEL